MKSQGALMMVVVHDVLFIRRGLALGVPDHRTPRNPKWDKIFADSYAEKLNQP